MNHWTGLVLHQLASPDPAFEPTAQLTAIVTAVAMMARWHGSLDRAIHDAACRRAAAWQADQIIASIRGMAGSRHHNIGVTYLETLTDIHVHGQDIAIPLGRHHDLPPPAAATAISRVLSMRWPPPFPSP